jgi:anti-sigma regulatory factor (Ser/Thr protein kinase)
MAPRLDLRLSPDAHAPAEARRSLQRVAGDLDDDALETLRLLVSELVSNSVRHARLDRTQAIELCVESQPRAIRVSVSDPGVGFDTPAGPPRPGAPSGWGLYLVEQMADRWGVDRNGITQVWFEIERGLSA